MSGDEQKPDVPEQEMGSVDEALAGFERVAGAEDESGETTPQDPVASLTAQLMEEQNRSLRIQADMDNLRKRMRREMEEDRKFAALPLIRDLLPAIDNLNRAIGSVQADESSSSLLEGVKMVEQQLRGVLQNHHCQTIEAEGQAFNPNWHEAILEQPSADHPKGTVLQVTQTGYRLHDRVIRPSQVIVSKEPA